MLLYAVAAYPMDLYLLHDFGQQLGMLKMLLFQIFISFWAFSLPIFRVDQNFICAKYDWLGQNFPFCISFDATMLLQWKSKTLSYELRVQIHELRVPIHELRFQIHELRVQIHKYEFKSTSYEFKFTSHEIESTSYEFESTSYEFKCTSLEIKSTSSEIKNTS